MHNIFTRHTFYNLALDMKNRFLRIVCLAVVLAGCHVEENIQDGQTAYNLKKYTLATELLIKEYPKAETPLEQGNIAWMIAESYENNNNYEQAGEWYNKAIESEHGTESIKKYALMLKAQERYVDAIPQFQKYLQEEPYRRPEINQEISACELALKWMERQEDEYERDTYIENLKSLNTTNSDFNPVAYKNNKLVFTSSRTSSTGENIDKWTGEKYYDLYVSDMQNLSSFSEPVLFEGPFNSEYNDGTVTFNKDFSEVFFTRCGSDNRKINDYCGLYVSNAIADDGWSEPVAMPFFDDTMNIGTPCLSPDGNTLFFAATNPDGYGGSDLYMSKRNEAGWDSPVNAGEAINSNGNEVFPYFGPDGTFYFSSDAWPGMGGLDIFSATWKNGKFSNIKNMEYPINSGADDFGILMINPSAFKNSDTLAAGYFSSNRKKGEGGDDIYLFYKTPKKLRPPVYVLQGKVLQKIYTDSLDVNSPVIDTIELKGAAATVAYPEALNILAKYSLKNGELFEMQADSMKDYKITGMKEGFFNNSVYVSTKTSKGKPGDTVVIYSEVVLDKKPIETASKGGGQIKLKNIYYDLNDTTLRAESFPELDKLVNLLNENPGITIQINSHTDSRGSDKYNINLSRGRANSVVAYLVNKGIAKERLLAKGWGETLPDVLTQDEKLSDGTILPKGTTLIESLINKYKNNKTDFEFLHQFNRRTTFNIVSDTINIESEQQDDVKSDIELKE